MVVTADGSVNVRVHKRTPPFFDQVSPPQGFTHQRQNIEEGNRRRRNLAGSKNEICIRDYYEKQAESKPWILHLTPAMS